MVAIIDYDAGNIKSVENAVRVLGRTPVLTRDPEVIRGADHVILPGVGAFGDAMARIRSYGLEEVIRETVEAGTPFLGICLGLQLLFEASEESPGVRGLGLLPGVIRRLPSSYRDPATGAVVEQKVPQIGWNDLSISGNSRLFAGLPEHSYVYFVHSYYLEAGDPDLVAATCFYGTEVHAAVERGNLFACQFHPEKSEQIGMRILSNFLGI